MIPTLSEIQGNFMTTMKGKESHAILVPTFPLDLPAVIRLTREGVVLGPVRQLEWSEGPELALAVGSESD